jgi:hypothetical protein
MQLSKVQDKKSRQAFIDVAKVIYRGDPTWVCPLDSDMDAIFDRTKNIYYTHGDAERWILKDENGKLAGRIAAFIDEKSAYANEQPTGGIGFFECIHNQKAAVMLFDVAREWLKEKGMQAMDGPINFGDRDRYWGLLVDGFTHPSYEVAYNPPYYRELYESYGFKLYYKQEGFHLDLTKPLPDRFLKIADWVAKKPGYRFEHMNWRAMDKQVADFAEVYNIAWKSFREDFTPLQPEYIVKWLKKGKAIIEEEFIWIAYFEKTPIAIFLMIPDVNLILKHLNGKMNLWNMLKFLYLKKKETMTRAKGILMGVIPRFHNLGIESAMALSVYKKLIEKKQYKEVEFSWVGDFNPKMRKIFISIGSVSAKHYITYRYLFDRNVPFKRFPIPGVECE